MNGAPDWQDGECCYRCRTQFTLVARKHHCRNCGNIFCAKCSSQQIPLPKLNIDKNVRVCDTCYEKIIGKNEDHLTLALNSKDKEKSETTKLVKTNSKNSPASSTTKPAASASAPSEQELKEEEELQLALALSLSETPVKVSFPECRDFTKAISATSNAITKSTIETAPNESISSHHKPTSNNYSNPIRNELTQDVSTSSSTGVAQSPIVQTPFPSLSVQMQTPPVMTNPPQALDYYIPERDREIFRFVGEVQSALEVFTNRLESCKLRNRPISNDAAIQSSFIRLNSEVQPKLSEYIKKYDDERADYERLQDKLSQIADARAALDALREEHQEKMRQQAAEADRLRQTQLATKLEAMRQKKSQMMQFQRELALQRIKEQEMALHQQSQQASSSTHGYQMAPATTQEQTMMNQQVTDPIHNLHPTQQSMHLDWHQGTQVHQLPDYSITHPSNYTSSQYSNQSMVQQVPTVQSNPTLQQSYVQSSSSQEPVAAPAPSIDRASIAQLERQFLPNSKPEEDTPLISFDD